MIVQKLKSINADNEFLKHLEFLNKKESVELHFEELENKYTAHYLFLSFFLLPTYLIFFGKAEFSFWEDIWGAIGTGFWSCAIASLFYWIVRTILIKIYLIYLAYLENINPHNKRKEYFDKTVKELAEEVKRYSLLGVDEIIFEINNTSDLHYKDNLKSIFIRNYEQLKQYDRYNLFATDDEISLKRYLLKCKKEIDKLYGFNSANNHLYIPNTPPRGLSKNLTSDSRLLRYFTSPFRKNSLKSIDSNAITKVKKFRPAKLDWESISKIRGDIGLAGEYLVMKFETQRIIQQDDYKYLDELEHTSIVKGDGAGYDILSVGEKGFPVYIEVKSTTGGFQNKLFFSNNEIEFMNAHPTKYQLFRVYNLDIENMTGDIMIYRGRDEINQAFELFPASYYGVSKN